MYFNHVRIIRYGAILGTMDPYHLSSNELLVVRQTSKWFHYRPEAALFSDTVYIIPLYTAGCPLDTIKYRLLSFHLMTHTWAGVLYRNAPQCIFILDSASNIMSNPLMVSIHKLRTGTSHFSPLTIKGIIMTLKRAVWCPYLWSSNPSLLTIMFPK
jgi:hypothetical protein